MRQFELTAYLTAALPGSLKDWPPNIQDAIYTALEAKAKEVGVPLEIVASHCDIDYGDDAAHDRPFAFVRAVEITAKSDIMSKEELMKFAFALSAGRVV